MGNIGFGKKLYISSIGIILMTIVIIAAFNFYQTESRFLSKGKASIENVAQVLSKIIDIQHGLLAEKIGSDMNMLKTEADSEGKVALVESRTLDLTAVDIATGKETPVTLPKLIVGLQFLTGDYKIVDKAGQFTDSEIMAYQLYEDMLIKVSTNRKNDDDSRPIGEAFSKASPQYQAIAENKTLSFLRGEGKETSVWNISPFKDEMEGVVAGGYCISRKVLTKDLEDLVKGISVNGNGFAFIHDGKGRILTHPDAAYLKLNLNDLEGGKSLLEKKTGAVSFEHNGHLYYAYDIYFEPWELYFAVAVSEAELMEGVDRQILTSALISGLIALVLGCLIIGLMNRQLMGHMNGMATLAREVANGNFQHSFDYQAKDAIQDTVTAMNDMVHGLGDMIRNLNEEVDTLGNASGELNRISEDMSEGSKSSMGKINTVASAAEEMSVNMDSVASAMEQASTNVETVAEDTGNMRNSIQKVAENAGQTRNITSKAVKQAGRISEQVQHLGQAADQINRVTDTISNISSQINLLALNATIEAARAGEAGKGFAVVANEIKDLAGQADEATEDIGLNINNIQNQISQSVSQIQEISGIIDNINTFVSESVNAIESQTETTVRISENVSQVSLGIQEVNENVAQSSTVSSQVADEITGVLETSQQIDAFSSVLKEKVTTLEAVMGKLRQMTEKFQI